MAYLWRRLSLEQREGLMVWRQQHSFPWHTPPHALRGQGAYHLTAACYQHEPILGKTRERMMAFCAELLIALKPVTHGLHAWCLLPNHYHLLVSLPDLRSAVRALGKLHGRASFQWNQEDKAAGRQVWHGASDRHIRSKRHFWATMNYIHHNPVRHGYVQRWQDWPFSSAHEFLARFSREQVEHLWREYPLKDYGRGWDDPGL